MATLNLFVALEKHLTLISIYALERKEGEKENQVRRHQKEGRLLETFSYQTFEGIIVRDERHSMKWELRLRNGNLACE